MTDYNQTLSVTLNEAGELEVVRRYPSDMAYGTGDPCPDRVVKEIYRSDGEKISLAQTVDGKHTPRYTVDEKIEF